ncbi:MAG TPA: protein-glutamate O-methyltransferase CheR [Polyangiaceae bacterium]|nr:protein-glutamate O-methyltransferase CheR [Polyangiaceae bacterium]
MSAVLGNRELEQFQRAIEQRLGLRCDDHRMTHLAEVLERRVQARRLSTGAYLAALLSELEASDELAALARELTIGETYFFRHGDQFRAFGEVALPERLSARAASRKLRLLSAGCASGEEAYSLAMMVREQELGLGFEISVQGLDLNPDALAKAQTGLYGPWSMRETSDARKQRWFTTQGKDFRLVPELLHSVRFSQHNLILDSPRLLPPATFDVIFCRNVLMYFTPEHAAGIVERLTHALLPNGFLFLGHAETLRGLSHDFHLRHSHNTFYYQRRAELEPRAGLGAHLDLAPQKALPELPAAPAQAEERDWVQPWLASVERSSERIQTLSESSGTSRGRRSEPAPSSRARDLEQPLQLLRSERFGDALELMQRLSAGERSDPAALLLEAALLTQQGELAAAEKACHELLRLDDLNAGAHYLLALCCERQGNPQVAVEHDRTAVYLDAAFAMPHLHLGLMARRRHDASAARQELATALALLEREEASRLLLFGGGFSRTALLALCRSELANLKGAP